MFIFLKFKGLSVIILCVRVFGILKMDDEDEKKDEQQETEVLQDSCSVPTAPDPAAQSQHKLPNVPVEVGSLDEPVRV